MTYHTKAFDKALYDETNEKGITACVNLLAKYGWQLKDRREVYTHDFVVEKDGITRNIEVEVGKTWKTSYFPYPVLSCPHRKTNSKADFYIRTNHDLTSFAITPMKTVLKSPVVKKDTIYTTNELFYHIPKEECEFLTLNSNESRFLHTL